MFSKILGRYPEDGLLDCMDIFLNWISAWLDDCTHMLKRGLQEQILGLCPQTHLLSSINATDEVKVRGDLK